MFSKFMAVTENFLHDAITRQGLPLPLRAFIATGLNGRYELPVTITGMIGLYAYL